MGSNWGQCTLDVEESHPVYNPHATIAYVKKGEAKKYAGNKIFSGINLHLDKIVFVNNKNKETEILLKK